MLEDIPPYLLRAYSVLTGATAQGLASAEVGDTAVEATASVTEDFSIWVADDDFWSTVRDHYRDTRLANDQLGPTFDEEVEILSKVLKGDRQAAILIAIELAARREGGEPDRAREAVSNAVKEGQQVGATRSGRSRAWRAGVFLKRAFTLTAGGLGIAADVVSPDVTGITKVASIAGGIAAIVNA